MKTWVIVASLAVMGVVAAGHAQVAAGGGAATQAAPLVGQLETARDEAAPGAATKPVTIEDLRAEARKEFAQELKDSPVGPTLKWSEVFALEQKEKLLTLTTTVAGMDEEKRLVIDGDPAVSGKLLVAREPGEAAAGEPRRFTLIAQAFGSGAGDLIAKRAEIYTLPAMGHLDFVYTMGTVKETIYVQVLQRPTEDNDELPVRMLVQVSDRETEERIADLKLAGETYLDLRRRYPEETARYLRPALELMGHTAPLFGTDAKMAWQVLGAEAGGGNAELRTKISAVLGKFESEKFADREAAQAELKAMGQPAAMLLRAWDRAKLSAQQNAEVDAFLGEYLALDSKQVDRFAKSPDFLLDVMLLEEKALREIAWGRLKTLRPQVAGYSADAGAEERAKQVARLRWEIYRDGASDPAATRPSEK